MDSMQMVPKTESKGFDSRHPLYKGDWKKSVPYVDNGMATDNMDEPHVKRKHAILSKYPQIQELYGADTLTIHVILASTAAQMFMAYLFGQVLVNWNWTMVLSSYLIGGSLTSLYGCIIHELSHNLAHSSPVVNRILALVVNTGMPVPLAASFRRYHLIHHAYLGVEGRDPDLPMAWEYYLVKGNWALKLVWMFCYGGLYVVRALVNFKPLSFWEIANWLYCLSVDFLVVYFWGWRAMGYLALSMWLGYGLHPGAAHFIQEHFTFEDGQETYSYYGSLNRFFINIGYHNEHHDFMQVPWTRLPQIKAIAPEFYKDMASHDSWLWMQINFIFSTRFGPQSRVKRTYADHTKARKTLNTKAKGICT